MRALVLVSMLWSAVSPGIAAQAAQDEGAVREVVERLFAHMKAGDADAMAGLLHEEARLVSTAVQGGVPVARVVAVDGWLESVASSQRELDERIYDTHVRVSGGLAMVWTSYDLFVDGVHSHCGVDLFDLVRTSEGWKIIGIADTRVTEGCRG